MEPFPLKTRSVFAWLAIFAIAMGCLEGIVVVYLREIYYPQGFDFPLTLLSPALMKAELVREAATLVMLISVAGLAGRNFLQRLAFFLFLFGVWDISYYAALWLFLGWPPSLLTWDILFLIPVTWIGPVLAPVINSLTMIAMAVVWMNREKRGYTVHIKPVEWAMILSGAFLILITYLWDYSVLMVQSGVLSENGGDAAHEKLLQAMSLYVPQGYNWPLFIAGELIIVMGFVLSLRHYRGR
jgi:hypothetical protein